MAFALPAKPDGPCSDGAVKVLATVCHNNVWSDLYLESAGALSGNQARPPSAVGEVPCGGCEASEYGVAIAGFDNGYEVKDVMELITFLRNK